MLKIRTYVLKSICEALRATVPLGGAIGCKYGYLLSMIVDATRHCEVTDYNAGGDNLPPS